MNRRLLLVVVAALGLSACSDWIGEKEAPPLPGKRISVLSGERNLAPELSGEAATIKLPPPEPNEDWPQAGGYSNHAMHHMEVGDHLQRIWRSSIGEGSTKRAKLLAQPVIAEGRVFTLDSSAEVRAFDAHTGAKLWAFDITPNDEDDTFSGGGLAYEDGQLFISTGFAQVVSLDAGNGHVLWRQSLSGPMRGAPTVRAGRVFVITVDNQTHALAAEDGAVLWSHQGISEAASLLGGTSPAVDGNVVVVPYSSGELFALRVDNGSVLWQEQLTTVRRTDGAASLTDIRARPIIDRGRVYAIGHADLLVAVDLRTGRRLWEREIGGIQSPWVGGDYLFLVNNNNEAVALDAKTGKVLWVTQLQMWDDEEDRTGRIIWTGPILASDRLILASSHGKLLSLSPYDGAVLGTEKSDGVSIAPSVAQGVVYFLTDDADLVAYR
ncbi:PQQ-like beta-propeller repeat protein [Magnetospirillum sulfuroxidans]|uniref:PQQ-binding-like beta-propeller repeat protein n=1 Tax=Magnetospirillum sulfuroxidans TaxID=611300 RepID=A0ABS5IAX4_9PROT|nr:PQQ-like beta-propeller repeat protein [Magnetospirillum sulfuroxidans]MBR9970863.1 PQQ-binding-like beta-propeller repeat protein [Magnetospirillum sulfuroxidans]